MKRQWYEWVCEDKIPYHSQGYVPCIKMLCSWMDERVFKMMVTLVDVDQLMVTPTHKLISHHSIQDKESKKEHKKHVSRRKKAKKKKN